MRLKVSTRKYLHVQFDKTGVYVYADNVRRHKKCSLSQLDNQCYISEDISIPISSLIDDICIEKKGKGVKN